MADRGLGENHIAAKELGHIFQVGVIQSKNPDGHAQSLWTGRLDRQVPKELGNRNANRASVSPAWKTIPDQLTRHLALVVNRYCGPYDQGPTN